MNYSASHIERKVEGENTLTNTTFRTAIFLTTASKNLKDSGVYAKELSQAEKTHPSKKKGTALLP